MPSANSTPAGTLDEDAVRIALDSIGLTDDADTARWIAALDIIRATGAELPRENAAPRQQEPATGPQRDRIKRDLADRLGVDAAASIASEPSLTKQQASEIIDSIKRGTFDADAWKIPF